jgi:hypothetical protein
MRSLHVRLKALTVVALCAVSLGASAPVALHAGDAITDRQIFAYLAYPVNPGDWVRYRVRFADRSTVVKTIGFGAEMVSGVRTLFIETHVRAQGVTGLPPGSTVGIGTDAVLKTYVAGTVFGDLAHPYPVVTSALKIGAFEYEIAPGNSQSYSALSGGALAPVRAGTIRSVQAVDMRVGEQTLHATHVVASFPEAPLPVGGIAVAYTIEVWQSPDAPLGTVAISSEGPRTVDWRLIAFGRDDYKTLFSKTLDEMRQAARPAMP